jgi:hypothetical protein
MVKLDKKVVKMLSAPKILQKLGKTLINALPRIGNNLLKIKE